MKWHNYQFLYQCFFGMVLDKPGKPEGPIKISDVHKEGCSLKWSPPEDDGGVPLSHYVVEKMDTETGKYNSLYTNFQIQTFK